MIKKNSRQWQIDDGWSGQYTAEHRQSATTADGDGGHWMYEKISDEWHKTTIAESIARRKR